MNDSRYWRMIAVLGIVAVSYVGHGLHNGASDGLPPFNAIAHAAEVSLNHPGVNGLYTASPDGKTIHVWEFGGENKVRFIASVPAD